MLFFNIIGGYLSIFEQNLELKKLGFFLIGVFHLKIALSYIYISEFVENKHNLIVSTVISAFDALTMFIICIALKYTNNLDSIFKGSYFVGVLASIVFVVLMKESPKHLLISNPRNSKQSIEILNYVARFNGSKFRLTKDSCFNFIGQAIEDESGVVNTSDSFQKIRLSSYIN